MDWADQFYSVTGAWWGDAESQVSDVDRLRSRYIRTVAPAATSVLELGCGYGATATALGEADYAVVAVDLSDRIERAVGDAAGNVRFVRDNFYTADLGSRFDVVCYWDGFGIGEDHDQVRLLKRVADDWLVLGGCAVVEVFHPDGWIADHGLEEIKKPSPELGYHHRLGHRRSFDSNRSRAIDTWWEIGSTHTISQSLRCYQPDEFRSLARTAGFDVVWLSDPLDPHTAIEDVATPCWSYTAVIERRSS